MTGASALYVGPVTHRRFKPKTHALSYRVFMLLLDLDDLPSLFSRLKLLRPGQFGLMSFSARDHGDKAHDDLKTYVSARLLEAGVEGGGPIRLLCMPRVLGYGFNPLSVYFCHDADERLTAILYEVRNTFGQRHSYLIATPEDGPDPVQQTAPKRFYVSPFMDMDLTYVFDVAPPGEAVRITIQVRDDTGPVLTAAFAGQRRELTDSTLFHAWITHPLLTLKVMAGIHWEAVKIVAKGFRFRGKPPLPAGPVTIGTVLKSSREGASHA
ncbi:DUF1365 domain-containing protein [Brevundimonas sp.]|jgi:DUF1365 family protein|uniref:DUF1365 domain-containing protein n=1 Tax=Brevundimonas sp. TaxID=1871086 RepID=UPI0035679D83